MLNLLNLLLCTHQRKQKKGYNSWRQWMSRKYEISFSITYPCFPFLNISAHIAILHALPTLYIIKIIEATLTSHLINQHPSLYSFTPKHSIHTFQSFDWQHSITTLTSHNSLRVINIHPYGQLVSDPKKKKIQPVHSTFLNSQTIFGLQYTTPCIHDRPSSNCRSPCI